MMRPRTIRESMCVLFGVLLMFSIPATAATPDEIEASIEAGITWLVGQQNANGSWAQYNAGGETGLALVKLQERAYELGYDSPFDPAYPYHQAVEDGLAFVFSQLHIMAIGPQAAGNPDRDLDGIGLWISTDNWHRTYETGICMMAITASRTPARTVTGPGPVNGWTYQDVLDDMVDYMAYGQDEWSGGWLYTDNQGWADNSNSGYAVLGLAYAESSLFGFNSVAPQFVKDELDRWITFIQNTGGGAEDGGSGYMDPWDWVNILKTGNLAFQMTYYGDVPSVPRFQAAMAYLGRTWNNPSQDPGWGNPAFGGIPHYQAMYCVMKGLEYSDVDEVVVGGSPRDWYQDFADAIVNTQQGDGSWPWDYWGGTLLSTEWALLTLEKSAPPPPPGYHLDIKPGSCPNPLNVKSRGKLPVALVGSETFDVTQLDYASLALSRADGVGGSVAPLEGPPGPHTTIDDVATPFEGELCDCHEMTGDGIADLAMKFSTPELVAALELIEFGPGDLVELVLSGTTIDGTEFTASDCILIVPRADFNADNHVDLGDFGLFQRCFSGPGQALWPGCEIADLDEDGDVDLSDFGGYQRCVSGPDQAVNPDCDD